MSSDFARSSTARTPDIVTVPAPPDSGARPPIDDDGQVTFRTLRRMMRAGQRIPALTCYDARTAAWLERAGVPMLLVGDTAAEMILGLPSTIHAPLDFMITITAAVRRGAPRVFLMGDMPFMSYHASPDDALHNAGRFMTEGRADAVKLEVDASFLPLVSRMSHAGVPVVAHLGCRPQHVKRTGGYTGAGRTADEATRLVEEAKSFEEAGAAMLLLEAVPDEVSAEIVARSALPVIGCGAGPSCHGEVIVLHDHLGLSEWQPAFAPPVTRLGDAILRAASEWCQSVQTPNPRGHRYRMNDEELRAFRQRMTQ